MLALTSLCTRPTGAFGAGLAAALSVSACASTEPSAEQPSDGGLPTLDAAARADSSVENNDANVATSRADSGALALESDASAPSQAEDASGPPRRDDAEIPAADSAIPAIAADAGSWIAFVSNRSGDYDIYLMHDDGTDTHPIVQEPGADLYPAWSPDGAKIAFASNTGSDAGAYALFVVDVTTETIVPVATGLSDVVTPAWSPDGSQLVVGGPGELYTVPAGGGSAVALTAGGFRDNSPAWSPDGARVYFSSNRGDAGTFDVWSIQPDGGGLAQVTSGAGILGGPAVSPNGATIALAQPATSSGSAGASTQVVLFDTSAHTLSPWSANGDSQPAFSPNGTKLAVASTRYARDNPEIVLLGAPGATNPLRLTNSPGVDGQPAFQPRP